MRPCCALVMAMLVVATRPASADEAPITDTEPEPPSAARRALAITAAVIPGIVLRGAGSWVAGERRAAKRLFIGAAGGLVVTAGAGGLIGISNGSPYSMPAAPLAIFGVGAMLTTWVEDIWVAAGGNTRDAGPQPVPTWSLEIGETWQHDAYRERLLQRIAASFDRGAYGARAAGMLDTGGDSWLVFADMRARLLGDDRRGDWVRVRAGGRLQRDRDDQVTQLVGELEVFGRLGLGHFDRAFRATFVEGSTGLAANRVTYASMVSEVDSILLGRFAWGAYVPGGEIALYYDHRRDGLAGGIDAWRASGFIGSFGASADIRVNGPWAVRGEFQIGNAYLTTLAVAYRGGL